MGSIREIIGNGTIFGLTLTANVLPPMILFVLPPGGFFVFGMLIALANKLTERSGGKPAEFNCHGCPGCGETACPMAEKEGAK